MINKQNVEIVWMKWVDIGEILLKQQCIEINVPLIER